MKRNIRQPSPQAVVTTAYPNHRFAVQDLEPLGRSAVHAREFDLCRFDVQIISTTTGRAVWLEKRAPFDCASGVAPVGMIIEGLYTIEELLDWQLFRRFITNQFGEDPGAGPYRTADAAERFESSAACECWEMMQRVWEGVLLYFVRHFGFPADGLATSRLLPVPFSLRTG